MKISILVFTLIWVGCARSYKASGIDGTSMQEDLELCTALAKDEANDEKRAGKWFVETRTKIDKCMQERGHKRK